MEEKKVLLSVQDLVVKFKVRGRSLTAIRGISLDIYDGESIAIVGESGSGKSVFTKTFANMLDSNGYVTAAKSSSTTRIWRKSPWMWATRKMCA